MKIKITIQLLIGLSILLTFSSFNTKKGSEYDVVAIYQGKSVDHAKALTEDGIKDTEVILFPMTLNTGKYVIDVTKKAKDVYKIDGKEIYIETKYCYEYSGSDVVLDIESSYGYTIGKIKFP